MLSWRPVLADGAEVFGAWQGMVVEREGRGQIAAVTGQGTATARWTDGKPVAAKTKL